MKNSITLEQIASKIGISRTTIYKVLNNKGNVSPETKTKILTALDEYNYTPISSVAPAVPKEPYTIVYIGMHYVSNNYFSALARRGIQKSYEKYKSKGLRVKIVEADFEHPQQQLQQIVEMRRKGYKNFIIAPIDEYLMKDKVLELKNDGCNILFLSRYLDASKFAFVGVDYYKSGMLAGEMLTKIMPMGGRIAVATNQSPQSDSTVRGRYRGFVDWVSQRKEFQIVEVVENVNTVEQAEGAFFYLADKYDKFNDLDAIYDITYRLSVFAENLQKFAPAHKPKLCGFDVYQEIVPYVRNSTIDFVIGQQIKKQAFDATCMMFNKIYYGTEYADKNYYARLDVVIANNIDCFIEG